MMTLKGVLIKHNQGVNTTTEKVKYSTSGIPVIRAQNISVGNIDFFDIVKIDEETFLRLSNDVKPKVGDILYTNIGSRMGLAARVEKKLDFIIAWNVLRMVVNEDIINSNFLTSFLNNPVTKQLIVNRNSSSTMPFVSGGAIDNLDLLLPPLPEQRAIAAVLSSFDDKIELLREQNKTLEVAAQTIFKEWFVNFNFPDADSKPYKTSGGKMIDSELGAIPEGWKVGTVNDIIERFSITYRCDQDDLSPKGKTPIFDQGTNGLYGYTERDADFQASTENPVILFTNHTCNMWFVNYPFCAIQNVIPFRGNAEYSTYFVFYMALGKIKFIEYKGHWPDFEQKKYIIPKPEIANRFAEFVKPLQYKIWNNNFQIQTLSKLRDALLPKLMKGEVRVKGFKD